MDIDDDQGARAKSWPRFTPPTAWNGVSNDEWQVGLDGPRAVLARESCEKKLGIAIARERVWIPAEPRTAFGERCLGARRAVSSASAYVGQPSRRNGRVAGGALA